MYTVVRHYKGEPGHTEEVTRRLQEGFVPLLRQVPGFTGYYVMDLGDGEIMSVSVYQDKAGADESIRRASGWVRENLAQWFPNPPQVLEGEVILRAED